MNLHLVAVLPLPAPKSPSELKRHLAGIIPTPIPADLTIEFIPPERIRISYTLSFTDVDDAAQTLFNLITVTWPTFLNSLSEPPQEP